jgi:hypothetical protein
LHIEIPELLYNRFKNIKALLNNDNDDREMTQTNTDTMVRRAPTSLNINEDLWDKVKIRAIQRHITATDAVEEALRIWLQQTRK